MKKNFLILIAIFILLLGCSYEEDKINECYNILHYSNDNSLKQSILQIRSGNQHAVTILNIKKLTNMNFNFNDNKNIKLTNTVENSYHHLLTQIEKIDSTDTYFDSGGNPIHTACSMVTYMNNKKELKKIILHNKSDRRIDNILNYYYEINSI